MAPNEQGNNQTNKRHGENGGDSHAGWWWIVVAALVLLGIVTLVGFTLVEHKDRVNFLTVNTVSTLVFVAIAMQVYVYRKQWKVMRAQTKIMDRSLVVGTRAYVGIHSIGIDFTAKRVFVQIENIGKVPASDIKVAVVMEVHIPEKWTRMVEVPSNWGKKEGGKTLAVPFSYDYGKTKLFPGNLNITILILLDDWYISDKHLDLIKEGHSQLVVRGNINFSDGFNSGKNSPFALRYVAKDELWVPEPIEIDEQLKKKKVEG